MLILQSCKLLAEKFEMEKTSFILSIDSSYHIISSKRHLQTIIMALLKPPSNIVTFTMNCDTISHYRIVKVVIRSKHLKFVLNVFANKYTIRGQFHQYFTTSFLYMRFSQLIPMCFFNKKLLIKY